MGSAIIKLAENEYIDWSSICDAPRGNIVNKEVALSIWGKDRVEKADKFGTSFNSGASMESVVCGYNRAGPNETFLTLEEIRRHYKEGFEDQRSKEYWDLRKDFQNLCGDIQFFNDYKPFREIFKIYTGL